MQAYCNLSRCRFCGCMSCSPRVLCNLLSFTISSISLVHRLAYRKSRLILRLSIAQASRRIIVSNPRVWASCRVAMTDGSVLASANINVSTFCFWRNLFNSIVESYGPEFLFQWIRVSDLSACSPSWQDFCNGSWSKELHVPFIK